ncbi:outer membrane beta-barrel family protein [Flavobacterium agricola]|uniref:Outer membrane beta-barrel family protein n=1 Tax=Flavobacterium agricola TaxID=2870839 RepID=A0ABY6LYS6_9FLAO|nr:outer membrane beta-barrel family protein [Flavobacterium agricola]UYW00585.1 outer membrane beta-barrel family protein [Flavobacterium agricola]
MKTYLLLFTCFCVSFFYGQNAVSITGKVITAAELPIEAATVYLNAVADSSLVNYSISKVNGDFHLPVQPINQKTFFVVSAAGYKEHVLVFDAIHEHQNLGTIVLEPASNQTLKELVVTTHVAPVKIKKDTIEFNANSFDIRPDATVKSLLEQLPGVMVADNGKVIVNGQEVSEFLLNGKPFFDTNGQIILNNLPAHIISKIQVSDYKTKAQKLANEKASSTEKTINLTIKDDKNKGFFGNVTGGYGTDEKYEGSLLLNYFNNDTKISVLGSANNINSLGFSNNEIFDNLVSGRNVSLSQAANGAIAINDQNIGGDKGIYSNKLAGFNYSDIFNKKVNLSSNYIFNEINFSNQAKTRTENLIPGNLFVTDAEANENKLTKSNNAAVSFEVKLGKNTTLQIDPKIDYLDMQGTEAGNSTTVNQHQEMVNNQTYQKHQNSKQKNVGANLLLVHNFEKQNRNIVAQITTNFNQKDATAINQSQTNFLESQTQDIRNQQLQTINNENKTHLVFKYKEPIAPNQELTVGMQYENTFSRWNREGADFNQINATYNLADPSLSFTNNMQVNEFAPTFAYKYVLKDGYFEVNASPKIVDYNINNAYLNTPFRQQKTQVLPHVHAALRVPVNANRKVVFSYTYNQAINSLNYLAPVTDLVNPFLTVVGNPDLKNTEQHLFQLRTFTFNTESKLGTYVNTNFKINSVGIIKQLEYDENFKGTLNYLSGRAGYVGYFNSGVYQSIKVNDNNTFKYEYYLGFGFDKNYGITNQQKYTSQWFSIYPEIMLSWRYKKDFDVKATYEFNFSNLNYNNYVVDKTQYTSYVASLQTTLYWPKNVFFANDLNFTHNGNITPGFKKDFLLWNLSIGHKFLDETFIAKIKVYDVLNQNTNVRRTANATQVIDQYNSILKRYVMFSLTYKLAKFGGKEKNKYKVRDYEDEE